MWMFCHMSLGTRGVVWAWLELGRQNVTMMRIQVTHCTAHCTSWLQLCALLDTVQYNSAHYKHSTIRRTVQHGALYNTEHSTIRRTVQLGTLYITAHCTTRRTVQYGEHYNTAHCTKRRTVEHSTLYNTTLSTTRRTVNTGRCTIWPCTVHFTVPRVLYCIGLSNHCFLCTDESISSDQKSRE